MAQKAGAAACRGLATSRGLLRRRRPAAAAPETECRDRRDIPAFARGEAALRRQIPAETGGSRELAESWGSLTFENWEQEPIAAAALPCRARLYTVCGGALPPVSRAACDGRRGLLPDAGTGAAILCAPVRWRSWRLWRTHAPQQNGTPRSGCCGTCQLRRWCI